MRGILLDLSPIKVSVLLGLLISSLQQSFRLINIYLADLHFFPVRGGAEDEVDG
jgi:hypothetical protein